MAWRPLRSCFSTSQGSRRGVFTAPVPVPVLVTRKRSANDGPGAGCRAHPRRAEANGRCGAGWRPSAPAHVDRTAVWLELRDDKKSKKCKDTYHHSIIPKRSRGPRGLAGPRPFLFGPSTRRQLFMALDLTSSSCLATCQGFSLQPFDGKKQACEISL